MTRLQYVDQMPLQRQQSFAGHESDAWKQRYNKISKSLSVARNSVFQWT